MTSTPRDRGLGLALDIQRRDDPKTWRAKVDAIADPDERAVAEEYLRGILARMKAQREARNGNTK